MLMSDSMQDDYLAKPVRGKTLEDMLLKWTVEGKRRSRQREAFSAPHIDNDSICTASSSASMGDQLEDDDQTPAAWKAPKVTDLGSSKTMMQRVISEEQAIALRDEKLIAASNPNPRKLSISMPPTPISFRIKVPSPALTVANVALLGRELEINPFDLVDFNVADDDESDSDESTDCGSLPEEKDILFEPRQELGRNSSSEMTVRPPKRRLYR